MDTQTINFKIDDDGCKVNFTFKFQSEEVFTKESIAGFNDFANRVRKMWLDENVDAID